jgi:Methyltransferase domain
VSATSDAVVVEIGVGDRVPATRPFARNAIYVALDIEPTLLDARRVRGVAANASHLPLKSSSIDHIVACNVLGDVGLGHRFEAVLGMDPGRYTAHVQELVKQGAHAELVRLRSKVRAMSDAVDATKRAVLVDAARVLHRGGDIVVIETMTPHFAREWIERTFGGRVKDQREATVNNIKLSCRTVRSHNRRRRYCNSSELAHGELEVWVLTVP